VPAFVWLVVAVILLGPLSACVIARVRNHPNTVPIVVLGLFGLIAPLGAWSYAYAPNSRSSRAEVAFLAGGAIGAVLWIPALIWSLTAIRQPPAPK
jgi:hypothetical protein